MNQDDLERDFENLLEYIRRSRGFDFSGYKRAGLVRRVGKRLSAIGLGTFGQYLDYLEAQPEEFSLLFNAVLINVTGFFRDPKSWEFIAGTIVPQLLAGKGDGEPLRVWSAGCASGEEAYTVAILLAETLGEVGFRERVKIYGTDVDEEALNLARLGVYGEKDLVEIQPELREKYFERADHHFAFRKDLRRSVIFGRHDLLQDPPISRIDLLTCRNTLMYFNAETQAKILKRLHFALNRTGFLFVGKAEMLLTQTNLFVPVEVKQRVFGKVARLLSRERAIVDLTLPEDPGVGPANGLLLRELAMESAPVGQIVVDVVGNLVAANDRARVMFNIAVNDVGRPLGDLDVSHHPVDLRSLLNGALTHQRPVSVVGAEYHRPNGDINYLDIQVVPILAGSEGVVGCSVSYLDGTRLKQLQEENSRTRQELETYSEELQASNEELETTNEELQSSNEELETTNEELQSANEELETMNEELQSTNEELETMNVELQGRTDDLNRATSFRDSILASLGVGVAVLDRELRVEVWNRKAADLWGLREDEVVGQYFYNLDIGLPVDQLRTTIRACLLGDGERQVVSVPAIDRRGRSGPCRVVCGPLIGAGREVQGVILLMEASDDGKLA
ncbi:MAG: CheR family methyltransferase [Chloroflexota bacterium]